MANKNGRSKRPVICIETGRVYESIVQASLVMGVCATSISNALSGKFETSAGYHWEYAPVGAVASELGPDDVKPRNPKKKAPRPTNRMTIEQVQKEAARRTRETGRRVRYADIQKEETAAMIRERDALAKAKLEKLKRRAKR